MTGQTLLALRWPRRFATWTLGHGTFAGAFLCIGLAMGLSILSAYRLGSTVRVEDLVFGPSRSALVAPLIASVGVERTAVLVYVLQRSFDALVVASALTPIFLWLLGSSAMHAAARLRGVSGHAYLPMIVLFAYAELAYQVPTSLADLALGPLGPAGAQVANAVGIVALVWFAVVIYRGIEQHYAVSRDRALAIFLIGTLVFYFVPFIFIVATLIAIVIAAAILQYF